MLMSCGGEKKPIETIETSYPLSQVEPEVAIEPEPEPEPVPTLRSKGYVSTIDTILIGDLYIVLDSIVMPEETNKRRGQIRGIVEEKLTVNVFLKIINVGGKKQSLPYAEIVKMERKNRHTVRIGGQDEYPFRMGSKLFVDTKRDKMIVEVNAKRSISGAYVVSYVPGQPSALAFWYYDDEVLSDEDDRNNIMGKLNKRVVDKNGDSMMKIIPADTNLKKVGFDITELLERL